VDPRNEGTGRIANLDVEFRKYRLAGGRGAADTSRASSVTTMPAPRKGPQTFNTRLNIQAGNTFMHKLQANRFDRRPVTVVPPHSPPRWRPMGCRIDVAIMSLGDKPVTGRECLRRYTRTRLRHSVPRECCCASYVVFLLALVIELWLTCLLSTRVVWRPNNSNTRGGWLETQ
jgi:hypothetical protein